MGVCGGASGRAGRLRARSAAVVLALALALTGAGCSAFQDGRGPRWGAGFGAVGEFPQIDEASLSAAQQRFLQIVRAEHEAQPPGTKYSQGTEEEWCADFVSWVAKERGAALTNANSGSWRIPGVYTLEESFRAAGTFHEADSGYTPKLGDVVMYRPDSPYGQHTNYVLALHDGVLTTVGGNEGNRVVVSDHRLDQNLRVVGYGER